MPYYSSYYRKLTGMIKPGVPWKKTKQRKKSLVVHRKPRFASPKVIKKHSVVRKSFLTITHKKAPLKKKGKKWTPARKAHVTWSKSMRMKKRMTPQDPHERHMVERIRHQSGMTHGQVMSLVSKARESDFDVEHEVDWNLSRDRKEQYELASRQMYEKLDPMRHKSLRSLMADYDMMSF